MSRKLTSKALAVLTLLAAATAAMTSTEIAAAEPNHFVHASACHNALDAFNKTGILVKTKSDAGVAWQISDLGREALKSGHFPERVAVAAKPAKKPASKKAAKRQQAAAQEERDIPRYTPGAVVDEPTAEVETAAAEPEIDFALWDSGVLTVQVGDETHLIPRAHVERLRDYLLRHLPRKAAEPPKLKSEIYVGSLSGFPLGSGRLIDSLLSDVALSNPKPEPWFDFAKHLVRQRAFSERTFGPGARVNAICDHISK